MNNEEWEHIGGVYRRKPKAKIDTSGGWALAIGVFFVIALLSQCSGG